VIELEVLIKPICLFTLGSSEPSTIIDIPFYKVSTPTGDEPTIPGSSVKGALRSSATVIANDLGLTSCGEIDPERMSEKHSKMGGLCDVCKLFGAPNSPSNLLISSFKPLKPLDLVTITQVSIDDLRMRAIEGRLFTREAVPPGTVFKGKLTLLRDKPLFVKLLLASLINLRFEVLGQHGVVDVKVENIKGLEATELDSLSLKLLKSLERWWYELP